MTARDVLGVADALGGVVTAEAASLTALWDVDAIRDLYGRLPRE